MAEHDVRVAIYCPANMNAIDGSSVWVQTMALALAGVPGASVDLVLAHPVTTERMIAPLRAERNIAIVEPPTNSKTQKTTGLSDGAAGRILSRLADDGTEVVVVRGLKTAAALAGRRGLRGKLWPYLTDFPQRSFDIDGRFRSVMGKIMSASPVLLCQTEDMRAFLETQVPSVSGRTRVLPPAIPNDLRPVIGLPPVKDDLRLCYAGKFAAAWKTLEMCDLPRQLADRGVQAVLVMVGDKINKDPDDPEFVSQMRYSLEHGPGVTWVGGVSRTEALEHMGNAHVGMSWRSSELNDSLELSTKLIEYCAVGTPPILNRTPMHERIFTGEYPLFVDSDSSVIDLLERVATDPHLYAVAQEMASKVPPEFTLEKATSRLRAIFSEIL